MEETALAPIGPRSVALRTVDELMAFAQMVADSPFAPSSFRRRDGTVRPSDIALAIHYGMEVGLTPLQSLQSIAVINNKPSLYGDALIGVILASGLLEDRQESSLEEIERTGVARCTVKRRGMPSPVTATFSKQDAQKAGLLNKDGPWRTYAARMLQMRARGFALRDLFADRLKGLIGVEEAWDYPAQPLQVGSGEENSTRQTPDEEEGKKLLLEAIKQAMRERIPDAATKEGRTQLKQLIQATFGVSGWTAVGRLSLPELQEGYTKLQPPEAVTGFEDDDVPDYPVREAPVPVAMATPEQVASLKVYAQRHGLSDDLDEVLAHYHPQGVPLATYQQIEAALQRRVAEQATQAQSQPALEV